MTDIASIPFTVNDFPCELIELFAPNYSNQTIATLRLVSKRFNEVFSQDRFYKGYLYYDEKCYLSDLKSNSTAVGVAEVVEEIKSGAVGKWKGYLKLQKAHLANWRAGRIDNFRRIDIPSITQEQASLNELYDEDGNHWFLFHLQSDVILCNVTTDLQHLTKTVQSHSATILPGQVMLTIRREKLLHYVYSFSVNENNGLSFEFQYKFRYDRDCILTDENLHFEEDPWVKDDDFITISGKCQLINQLKNIFVGIVYETSCIHVWDLKSQSKIREVSIHHHRIWHDFLEANRIREGFNGILMIPGEFPNVIFQVKPSRFVVQISIYNVVKDQVTFVIQQRFSHVIYDCLVNKHIICFNDWRRFDHKLNIYKFEPFVNPEVAETRCPRLMYSGGKTYSYDVNVFDRWKTIIFKSDGYIRVLEANNTSVSEHQIPYYGKSGRFGFIHPDLLLIPSMDVALNVISSLTGKSLFAIKGTEGGIEKYLDYYKRLQYPSKMFALVNNECRIYYM